MPKSFIHILSAILPVMLILKSSHEDIIIKGNSDGITVLNHSISVLYAEIVILPVKIIIFAIIKNETISLNIFFFNKTQIPANAFI